MTEVAKAVDKFQMKVLQTTVAKQSTVPAKSLPRSAVTTLHFGSYDIIGFKATTNNHWNVMFVSKLPSSDRTKEYQSWVVWGDDVSFFKNGKELDLPKDIVLPVPFFAQISRPQEPTFKSVWEQNRTCNTSSCAMAAKFLGAKIQGDDDYYTIVQKYGDSTSHEAQTQALSEVGIKSEWRTDLDFEDLDKSLNEGKPIVLGILHRGTLEAPSGGHMICCNGKTAKGNYFFLDPYGSLLDGYSSDVNHGQNVIYPREILKYRWLLGQSKSGWGRLF